MTQVLVTEDYLYDTAYAIREKGGTQATLRPSQFAGAIDALPDEADLGTKSISSNGTYAASSDSLDGFSSVIVNVANSYSASDEGKVVDSGALVAQTSTTKTANGTYDTTTNDEVVVAVPLGTKTVTQNGTYDPADDSLAGYSEVTVNVSGGGGSSGNVVLLDEGIIQGAYNSVTSNSKYYYPARVNMCSANAQSEQTANDQAFYPRMNIDVNTGQTDKGPSWRFHIPNTRLQMQFLDEIPTSCTSLNLTVLLESAYDASATTAKAYLVDAIGLSGSTAGSVSGNILKTVTLSDYTSTTAAINSQQGVTINSTNVKALDYQTVEIDLSDITDACYLVLYGTYTYFYLYSIYAE